MSEKQTGDATVNSDSNTDNQGDGNTHDTSASKMIPKSRFDEVVNQRNEAQAVLKSLAEAALNEVPEEYRELVPDKLSPQDQIIWIRKAKASGIFGGKTEKNGPDSKRPGGKAPADFEGLSPQAMMSQGYESTK